MTYDKLKDKELWSKSATVGLGHDIVVGVYKYDTAVPKVGMVRKMDDKFKALGRLRYEEVSLVIPLLQEAQKILEENKQPVGDSNESEE